MGSFRTTFHGVARRVMVLMMLADGRIEETEVEAIRSVYRSLAGVAMTPREVDEEVLRARADGRSIEDFLAVLAGAMEARDKAMVVRAAYLVAVADGSFGEHEQALLATVGRALRMSPREVEEAIATSRAAQ